MAALGLLGTGFAVPASADESSAQSMPFDFDALAERMRQRATTAHAAPPAALPAPLAQLDYDGYRRIQFRAENARWQDNDAQYHLHAFHPGWLYPEPVKLYEVSGGEATPLLFSADDFDYHDPELVEELGHDDFPGIAGFRINHPLNRDGAFDELVSFLGASYFRALGRDNIYGLSARGLVINSWGEGPEEFPRFSEFYLERPVAGEPLTIYAALESESVTGAYRFVITPAGPDRQETSMEVTARLFFRHDVRELGVAPLTSMFVFSDVNRSGFDDYRPQVHDSNGLAIERATGERLWRPLNNTATLGNSYFGETDPRSFGLFQRGRAFESYQDAGAHYERRPSLRVEPLGDWGAGLVRLIEIPTRTETDDNIVAFWIPSEPVKAGDAREFNYRLIWGDLEPQPDGDHAYVTETLAGQGGVSGVENADNLRKFVIDFTGGPLESLPGGATIDVLATASGGKVETSTLSYVPASGVWRLVIDVASDGPAPIELKAYLVSGGHVLTETWLYQWRDDQ
ncbi:glucans biosynthesis protein G [Devosia pacifica]|uniref:Glucans biosynthesis protein G n=2 Tax=Devosia pacifica TaxID=1335967 RepID=A0A918S3N7_9HYPH|nr:glucans biosynthesis protein G [Devosia pacifica]